MPSFNELSLPERSMKPRSSGMTMVLDSGIGRSELADFLEINHNYVDIIKFGWGTSVVVPGDVLKQKIALIREFDLNVCPGGTMAEIAWQQGQIDHFFDYSKNLGFNCIEISDGLVDIPREDKLGLIQKSRDMGFTTYSEVGKKSKFDDTQISLQVRVDEALQELKAGSEKIILEARESGSVGIFDQNGEVIAEYVNQLVRHIEPEKLIFEAPKKDQQVWLIQQLGQEVNLGNIAPGDALNLETLRLGLRADTHHLFDKSIQRVRIVQGIEGASEAAIRNDIIICVDTLRASTTMVAALSSGVGSIKTVGSHDECTGELTAGEFKGEKLPGLTFDNSPVAFNDNSFDGDNLTLVTTNGTRCIEAALIQNPDSTILIGALVNARSVAEYALNLSDNRDISIVMAGRRGSLASEDLIAASRIIHHMPHVDVIGEYKPVESQDLVSDLLYSGSGSHLCSLGREEDVRFCAQEDVMDTVPVYSDGYFIPAPALP